MKVNTRMKNMILKMPKEDCSAFCLYMIYFYVILKSSSKVI